MQTHSTAETDMPRPQSVIDGERIRKARTLRRVDPIHRHLATALADIPELRFVKLFPGRLTASNRLLADGKQNPIVAVGAEGITGVELLIDADNRIVQFYAITSAAKGCGRKMVEAAYGKLSRSVRCRQ